MTGIGMRYLLRSDRATHPLSATPSFPEDITKGS